MSKKTKKKKVTTDAVEILHHRYFKGKPKMLEALKKERLAADIAERIYTLRTQAGLSQAQLAKLVDTKQSVISRLESADYNGHSLTMVRRIADALDCQLDVKITPRRHSGWGHASHHGYTLAAASRR